MDNKKSRLSILTNGFIKENPVLVLVLGTCPTLAITTNATYENTFQRFLFGIKKLAYHIEHHAKSAGGSPLSMPASIHIELYSQATFRPVKLSANLDEAPGDVVDQKIPGHAARLLHLPLTQKPLPNHLFDAVPEVLQKEVVALKL